MADKEQQLTNFIAQDKTSTEQEQQLSKFIKNFVGNDTCRAGQCSYIDADGVQHDTNKSALPARKNLTDIRVVVIADTHECHNLLDLPAGDVLLHCGDFLMMNWGFNAAVSDQKLREFNHWLASTPFKERVVIGGNHDQAIEAIGKSRAKRILSHCNYVENEHLQLKCGLTLFGSPASVPNSTHSRNKSFQSINMAQLDSIFANVSPDIDILMTHGPLDTLPPAKRFLEVNRTPFFFCGHVHEDYGADIFNGSTICCNASTMARKNNRFQPCNAPMVMDIPLSARRKAKMTRSHL